jgi:hypothetical protein
VVEPRTNKYKAQDHATSSFYSNDSVDLGRRNKPYESREKHIEIIPTIPSPKKPILD